MSRKGIMEGTKQVFYDYFYLTWAMSAIRREPFWSAILRNLKSVTKMNNSNSALVRVKQVEKTKTISRKKNGRTVLSTEIFCI